ncbi:MAG: NADH-quinone oxidoreductase subunit M [Bacteroidia bacterium]|nr:NADH-quinone oxidoreductase subunit M [Bacteroidia bacterium]MDW8159588.1 NADH-quinone oxidoreductase subunit M [Bacteroidia bacterium]
MSQESTMYNFWLNFMLLLPTLGVPVILLAKDKVAKYIAMLFSVITFLLSVFLYVQYQTYSTREITAGLFVFETAYNWIGMLVGNEWVTNFDIKFITGVDGISIYLVLLTTLLFPLSIWFSWGSITENEKAYYALLLLLETGVLGVFVALDLVLFYIFFEVGLIPMYFLIGLWGGKDRIYAAVKFFLYTLVGSLLMLIAILYLGYSAGQAVNGGVFTTDLIKILNYSVPTDVQPWLFWGFFLSFAIKVPLFPFHTWLPDAHVQAPTAGSVLLAGVLLKLGTYGIVRFCLPLFPAASLDYATAIAGLGLVGIIYGAMAAMVQTDIKKLIAYSSVAHMGFVVMGTFAMTEEALSGAVLQMINHGVSTGALFLIVGMIYDRTHTREIAEYEGVATHLPIFTLFFMISTLSSIGLPGLNGFVGEFLILLGSFKSSVFHPSLVIFATTGVIIAAVYMLWMFRRVMFGKLDFEKTPKLKGTTDLNSLEVGVLLPLVILMFAIGLYATPFLEEINKSSAIIISKVMAK